MCNTCGCKSAETFDADSGQSWSEENRPLWKDGKRRKTTPSSYNPVCVYCGESMWSLGPYEMKDGSRVGNKYQKDFFLMGCRNEDCRNYGYGAEEFGAETGQMCEVCFGNDDLPYDSDHFTECRRCGKSVCMDCDGEMQSHPDWFKVCGECSDVLDNVHDYGAEGLYECSECKHWNRNPVAGITKCKKCGHGSFNQVKKAETFGAESEKEELERLRRLVANLPDSICQCCGDSKWTGDGVNFKCVFCEEMKECDYCNSSEDEMDAETFGAERRYRYGNRYITRNSKGQIKKNVSVGRSLAADRRRKAKTVVKGVGQGGSGDYRAEDIVESLQSRTRRAGFSINGWVASALVIGASFVAGQRFEKR